MAGIKRHVCQLNARLLRNIEYVLPKLKYSVYTNQITRWLENFEEHEVELALDFLFYLEYISFSELQLRINEQLSSIVKRIRGKCNILLIPFAPYPKSSDLIMYLLSKTATFLELKKENKINYTKDLINFQINEPTVLVYVDDFIGSGNSFSKWYGKNGLINLIGENSKIQDEQMLLTAIVMEDGHIFLNQRFPDILIYAEIRSRVFSATNSPFNVDNTRGEMRKLCLKYGRQIKVDFVLPNKEIYAPFGYDDSEALIAFDYGTPNNTLSIIWGEDKWAPIYPRFAHGRMRKAKEIKMEAAYYLGVINKLGLQLDEDYTMDFRNTHIQYNSREDYGIVVLSILKEKKFNDLQICQILGITIKELRKIYAGAIKKKIISKQHALTKLGLYFIKEIKSKLSISRFREADTLEDKSKEPFVPSTWEGKT